MCICLFLDEAKIYGNRVKVKNRHNSKDSKSSPDGKLNNKQTLDLGKSIPKELQKTDQGIGGIFSHQFFFL